CVRFGIRSLVESGVERRRLPNGFLLVELQAVDLRDARIRVTRLNIDRHSRRAFDEPLRDGCPHDNPRVRTLPLYLSDDFEIAGRMAKAMTRDVEDDDHSGLGIRD